MIKLYTTIAMVTFLSTSCFKVGVSNIGSTLVPGNTFKTTQVKAAATVDGGVSAAIDISSGSNQMLKAEEGSAIQGTAASFPPGSLSINTSISIEESASIATSTLTSELNLQTDITQSGTAVSIQSASPMDARQPFSLSIPLPALSALASGDLWANLIVIYRVSVQADKKVISGVIPRSEIIIKDGIAQINSLYFGSFQTAVTSVPVTDRVQADSNAIILTKKESINLPALSVVSRSPLVVKANAVVEINGINFRPTMIVAVAGKKVGDLKVLSDSKASFITPSTVTYGLNDITVEQDGISQTVSILYAGTKTDLPIMLRAETEVCLGEKFYDGTGALKMGSRPCNGLAACTADGQTNCTATVDFPAAAAAGLAAKIHNGLIVAGIKGTASDRPLDCNVDGSTQCVATASFPAVDRAISLQANSAKIRAGVSIAGVAGTLANCSLDGATSCVAVSAFPAIDKVTKLSTANLAKIHSSISIAGLTGTSGSCAADGQLSCFTAAGFPAADVAGAAAKLLSGQALGGITGTVAARPNDCANDGDINCVAIANFPAVDKVVNLAAGKLAKIHSSVTVGGATGTLGDCSADGGTGCLAVPGFVAANAAGAAAKILTGQVVAGISGTAAIRPLDCSTDNGTDCIAITAFPSVVKANINAGLLKTGTVVAGISGAFPSASFPLTGASATADLTAATFNAQIKSSTVFEYFDGVGTRYTGYGDTDIQSNNILVGLDIFGTTGTFGANCTSDGQIACLTTSTYKSVDTSQITPWDIRAGKSVGGIAGSIRFNRNSAKLAVFNRTTGTAASTSTSVADAYDTIDDYNNNAGLPSDLPAGFPAAAPSDWLRDPVSDSDSNGLCNGSEQCVYKDRITGFYWFKDDAVVRTWEAAITYCENLTSGTYSDWRLPAQKELAMAYIDGISSQKAPLTLTLSAYWSATTNSTLTSNGYGYSILSGDALNDLKTNSYATLCVR